MGGWEISDKFNKLGNQSKLGGGFRLMTGNWEKYGSNGWKKDILTLISVLNNIISFVQLHPKSLTIW